MPDWRSLPSLSALRAFDLTAREGSFASAARALNVTHAAIAQQVRALEREIGVTLLRRAGRSVTLTEEGVRLASGLGEGFDTIEQAIETARAQVGARPVQIASTIFIAQSIVLPRLDDFWARHPEVRVAVSPSQMTTDLVAGGFDLAIRASETTPHWPDADFELLLESEVIAVGAPSVVTDDMPPLDRLPWVWSPGADHQERPMRAFGLDPEKLRNADLGVPFLQLNIVRSGLGLIFAPEINVRQDLAAGTLRRVPMPSPFSMGYYAVTPKGPVRPQTRVFIEWLKGVVREESSLPKPGRQAGPKRDTG
ncbi:LysR family transcriptional regulator [Mameliella sp. CS4]|uniref:LysR family transcriptional regulator n=1 Tax=Mameliella sp. CS4 TaxID=2862329 RepID=UPI001C5EB36B|nr:LysR substrate-binding domain-containing protein [Mameliella sp. CS4]MBW4985012.1 LysR family transcriptional regulator [Mameliella sp. CS4]